MGEFNLKKFLIDVFQPVPEDKVTVMVDLPHGDLADNDVWKKRREMAEEWRNGFVELSKKIGFRVNPIVTYLATAADNAEIPKEAEMDGREVVLNGILKESTLIVALTEFSASASLINFVKADPKIRCASMPHCIKEMEETALAADYAKVAKLCEKLKKLCDPAVGSVVKFSTGHECYFDLRYRDVYKDDGMLPPNKKGLKFINLPSGEFCQCPYEGEKEGESSKTSGELPQMFGDELVVYKVENNKIVKVIGDGPNAKKMTAYFNDDGARRNIAEYGLGCNDKAIMRGIIIEDEKAAFHWAYGRSDHLGGINGVDKFKGPETVVHEDVLYAKGSPVTVSSIELIYGDGSTRDIWDGEWYVV